MRLNVERYTVRSVAIALLLTLAPLPGAGATRPPVDPADLLDIELDDILPLPETTTWRVLHGGPPLALYAEARPSLAPDRIVLPVADIDVMSYEAELTGGTLRLLADGGLIETVAAGEHVEDVALQPWAEELVWEFVPADADDRVWLTLRGARALVPPVLDSLWPRLVSWCGGPAELRLSFRFSLPLVAADIDLRVDQERVGVETGSYVVGGERHHYLSVEVPRAPDGTPAIVDATLQDALGVVWELLAGKQVRHDLYAWLYGGPDGWVYDLRPTIGITSSCVDPGLANYRFTLDGVDRTADVEVCGWALVFRFEEDLAFNETHAWRFEVTLLDGTTQTLEGTLVEGLDVMEFELERLALVWQEAYVSGPVLGEWGVKQVFGDLRNPTELPPVYSDMQVPLVRSEPPILLDGVAHLRAVYSPVDVLCEKRAVSCAPYLGNAPGFEGPTVAAATLTVTAADGREHVLPGAGQFAAASRLTVLGQGPQEIVASEIDWALGLGEIVAG